MYGLLNAKKIIQQFTHMLQTKLNRLELFLN